MLLPFVVYRVAACLGTVWGRHARPRAAKWELGEWIHKGAPKAAERRRSRSRCVPCNTVHRGVAQGRRGVQVMLVAAGRNRCWGPARGRQLVDIIHSRPLSRWEHPCRSLLLP